MRSYTNACLCVILCFYSSIIVIDGSTLGNGPLPFMVLNYLTGTVVNVPVDVLDPPQNRNDSLGYKVYTKRNPERPCFLEPTLESLQACQIDAEDPLILFVHGFIETLKPGNLFEVMKDKILENGPYTVIILDWTKYNGPPYTLAVLNMQSVGPLAGEMMNFIIEHAGVKAKNMRLTGHSLGAHLVGYIGRNIPDLALIDGLDPAGILFSIPPVASKLSYTDAKLVRAMHSSTELTGIGITEPLGHIDFYVNGGALQPHCEYGAQYQRTSGDEVTVNDIALKQICPHELINTYYIESISKKGCRFLATKCDSYEDFQEGMCPPKNSAIADMGFYAQNEKHFPPGSKFYLRTKKNPPYCLKKGYKPYNTTN